MHTTLTGETLYRKVGNKYEPVGINDNVNLRGYGAWLTVVVPNGQSTRRVVESDHLALDISLGVFRDILTTKLSEEYSVKPAHKAIDPEWMEEFNALQAKYGLRAPSLFTYGSLSEGVDNAIESWRQYVESQAK